MSGDKREIVTLEKRMTISDEDLEQAFQECDDAFWAKAIKVFPEVESGDTDPMATHHYSETVKAFMKHWLETNARIMVGGLTEAQAVELARLVGEAQETSYAVMDDNYLLATPGTSDMLAIRIVELQLNTDPQGFAVQVTDEAAGTTTLARTQAQLEIDIALAFQAIKERIDK